jgi:hypothetical protein
MHEHVFVLSPEIEKTAAEWDEEGAQAIAVPTAEGTEGSTGSTPSSTSR